MQSGIKIIKRDTGDNKNGLFDNQLEKTGRQREQETANTVKSWVAEWEARNRALKTAAASLLRSLENRSECPTQRFAVVKG